MSKDFIKGVGRWSNSVAPESKISLWSPSKGIHKKSTLDLGGYFVKVGNYEGEIMKPVLYHTRRATSVLWIKIEPKSECQFLIIKLVHVFLQLNSIKMLIKCFTTFTIFPTGFFHCLLWCLVDIVSHCLPVRSLKGLKLRLWILHNNNRVSL